MLTQTIPIDSRGVAKGFRPEVDSQAAQRIREKQLAEEGKLLAPELLIAELANGLWKRRVEIEETVFTYSLSVQRLSP